MLTEQHTEQAQDLLSQLLSEAEAGEPFLSEEKIKKIKSAISELQTAYKEFKQTLIDDFTGRDVHKKVKMGDEFINLQKQLLSKEENYTLQKPMEMLGEAYAHLCEAMDSPKVANIS